MRYSASDKTEIIRMVEQSPWPARRTLEKLGIPRSSFYRWYDRYQRGGPEVLADRPSQPDRIWNRIPEACPLSDCRPGSGLEPELSPRELAVRFTDEEKYFVSEASVYRLLKAHDRITSLSAYIVIKAAEAFKDKTTASPTSSGRPDFTYLKITGWGWYYLSTVLDDFSRFILSPGSSARLRHESRRMSPPHSIWRWRRPGSTQMNVVHRPRHLSDNGSSYVASDLAEWLNKQNIEHVQPGAPYHPQTQGKIERWHQTLKKQNPA